MTEVVRVIWFVLFILSSLLLASMGWDGTAPVYAVAVFTLVSFAIVIQLTRVIRRRNRPQQTPAKQKVSHRSIAWFD